MAAVPSTSSTVEKDKEDIQCSECFVSYGDFCVIYSGHIEKLILWCQRHGLILKQKECGHCKNWCRLDFVRKAWRCDKTYKDTSKRKKRCNYSVSIFKGSWFENSHIDLETNIKFVLLYVLNGFNYAFVRDELSLSDKSINDWSSFCREVIVNWVFNKSKKIGGEGFTVEIDESKFGKRKYNVGRVVEGQWVFGGICRESRQFFMVPVEDRTSETLLQVIKDFIASGTTVISDCWRAYDCLEQEGYKHLTVNHSVNFVDPVTRAHTNTIERLWRDTKNLVPKYGRRKAHFVGYLAVAYFKLQVKESKHRLHEFAKAAAQLYPPTQ